jgi:hypothetical protein
VRRENIFKNVVFQRLLEIREEKRKPKLGEILSLINKSTKGGGSANKDFIINKIKLLYAVDGEEKPQEDKKWDQLMASFDRLRKAVTHQRETLTELDNKALVLLKRRQEREAAGEEYLKKLQMYKDKQEIEKL